jgi:3',5'-cyclic AMP phosphodiesterase CpdA
MNTRPQQAMTNIHNKQSDFINDLGDTFYVAGATSQGAVNLKFLAYRAPLYIGKIGSSVPIFLASGNHENEEGWNFKRFDDTKAGDQWVWSSGAQQFQWLGETLEDSDAKYQFIFSHHILGDIPGGLIAGTQTGYVRGEAEAAADFEWGGGNADGMPGFADHRDEGDFESTPIHLLMVANEVSAYFHGHDHQFVYGARDGMVYQEVASPGMSGTGFGGIYSEGNQGTYNTTAMLPNAGHLLITVDSELATVEYISSNSPALQYPH